jgi:2-keto-4-pentenoate hydratase/2-oxohepta-3-ene-1,7-dioic acid hydratase in catechol pathway
MRRRRVRLVRYGDDGRIGVVVADRVIDVGASLDELGQTHSAQAAELRRLVSEGATDWRPLIAGWKRLEVPLNAIVTSAADDPSRFVTHDLDHVRLRPPLISPGARVFAGGVNFSDHVAQASRAVGADDPLRDRVTAAPPTGFFVIPGSILGHEDPIAPPKAVAKLDYEAEVAAVLGSGGRNLDPDDVRIWGYTGWNDLSIRDPHLGVGLSELDKGALSWALQKNFEGGNVCGPTLAVGDAIDVSDLRIVSRVNGEQRQNGTTAQMIRSFAEIAAYISEFLAVAPGDIITSGTPGGTAIEQGVDGPFLRTGDVVEIEIEGVGVLRNRIVAGV